MSEIWFTSDTHYGHHNIISYCGRPFQSSDEMNRDMVRRFNESVKPEDTTYHLGDFSLNEKMVPIILPILNGTHHLIAGNHDQCHPRRSKWQKATERYLGYGFKSVQIEASLGDWLLHHMPYTGDHTEKDRYSDYRPKNKGRWLLCGHVHEKWKQRDRMINVGVDVWDYAPVNIKTLYAMR